MKPNTFDEGFNIELVQNAFFDGELEIPIINPPEKIIIPSAMIVAFVIDKYRQTL